MLNVTASVLLSIIGSGFAVAEDITTESMRTGLVDLIILGRIPFTDWFITFEPFFVLGVTVCLLWLMAKAYQTTADNMREWMWRAEDLENKSL